MSRLIPLAALAAVGCASTLAPSRTAASQPSQPVAAVNSEDDYATARAEYDALAPNAPERAAHRRALEVFLLGQVDKALDGDHLDAAAVALRQALTLWDADELARPVEDAPLAEGARKLERAFSRRGGHKEAICALAAELSLERGPQQAEARARFDQLTGWLRSGVGDDSVDGRENLVEDLESAAQVWPSRFVVEQLASLYLDRKNGSEIGLFNRRLRRGADLRELIQSSGRANLAYELARLYLRISRPDEALKVLSTLTGKPGDDAQLRGLLERVTDKSGQPDDHIKLAQLFGHEGRDDLDVALRICKDAQRRFPREAGPRICTGRYAATLDQIVVAVGSFEEAVKLDPSNFEAWDLLGRLYQLRLGQLVSDENLNLSALEAQLKKVEGFQADAARRFPDKKLHYDMGDALYEVGRGYYNSGRVVDAERYLEKSIALEASAPKLELLGQIHLKKGDGKAAAELLDKAQKAPSEDPGMQLWWRAKVRRTLADALELAGDSARALETRKAAVADWDQLVSLGLTAEALVEAHLERGKVLYQLGERELALDAFNKAIDAKPEQAGTYADVIAFLVARGELEQAVDAYHRALGRNEVSDYLKVYCSLWIVDLARRAGEPEDPLATAYLKSTDGAKWYDDLARWATGREADGLLLSRANTPARKAESAFYRALKAWHEGKKDDALGLWKQVLDTDMMAFFEYDMAAYYLKAGGAPSKPALQPKPKDKLQPPPVRRAPDGSI